MLEQNLGPFGGIDNEVLSKYIAVSGANPEAVSFRVGVIIDVDQVDDKLTVVVRSPDGSEELLTMYGSEDQLKPLAGVDVLFELDRGKDGVWEVLGFESVRSLKAQIPSYSSKLESYRELAELHDLSLDEDETLIYGIVRNAEPVEEGPGVQGLNLLVEEADGNVVLLFHQFGTEPDEYVGRAMLFVVPKGASDQTCSIPITECEYVRRQFREPELSQGLKDLQDGLELILKDWQQWEESPTEERSAAPGRLLSLGLEPRSYLRKWLSDLLQWCSTSEASADGITNLYAATGLGKTQFLAILCSVLPQDAQVVTISNSLFNLSQLAPVFRKIEIDISHACSKHIPLTRRGSAGRIHLMSHAASDMDRTVTEGGVIELRGQLTPSFVFVDEMDLMSPRYMKLIERWRANGAVVIGVSATRDHVSKEIPWNGRYFEAYRENGESVYVLRLGEEYFGKTFSALPMGEAIESGFLPRPQLRAVSTYFSPTFLNGTSLGDDWEKFKEFLWASLTNPQTQEEVLFTTSSGEQRFRPLAIRVSTRDRALDLAGYLTSKGLPTAALVAETPSAARDYLVAEMEKEQGEIHALVGVQIVGRGMDTSVEWIIDAVCSGRHHSVLQFIGRGTRARSSRMTDAPPLMWQILPAGDFSSYVTHAEALSYVGLNDETLRSLAQSSTQLDQLNQKLARPPYRPVSLGVQKPHDTLLTAFNWVNAELGSSEISWTSFLSLLEYFGYGSLTTESSRHSGEYGHVDIRHLSQIPGVEDPFQIELQELMWSPQDLQSMETDSDAPQNQDIAKRKWHRPAKENLVALVPLIGIVREVADYDLSDNWLTLDEIRRAITGSGESFSAKELFSLAEQDDWSQDERLADISALQLEDILDEVMDELASENSQTSREDYYYKAPVPLLGSEVYYNILVLERAQEKLFG